MNEPSPPFDPALERALKRRPVGWVPPGPAPRGALGRPELSPTAEEDLSFLTGDFRIFQRRRGHRWSLDDFATALFAIRAAHRAGGAIQPEVESINNIPPCLPGQKRAQAPALVRTWHGGIPCAAKTAGAPARYADLGCGIGSVLMMVAWAFPETRAVGIEAQELSVGLARRSLAYNGIDDRVRILHGDLRDAGQSLAEPNGAAGFDLVTGTPPYIALGHGLVSEKEQRGPCCFETRGGIEEYCLAAAQILRPGGIFTVCAGALPEQEDRAEHALRAAGLSLIERVDVVPRAGKAVLFRVFVTKLGDVTEPRVCSELVVRDAALAITDQMRAARDELGLPPLP